MRRLILLILVLIGLLLSIPIPTQAQSADNPYIYYFLDKRSAFVIERADGTDTRLLGEGLMPRGVNRVDGPGWSPSGKWFAWRAEIVGPYGNTLWEKSYLIRSDGQVSPLLDGVKDAKMVWSPNRDLLLVTSEVLSSGSYGYVSSRLVTLIDPTSNKKTIVKGETFINSDTEAGNLTPIWLDEQHGVVKYSTEQTETFLISDPTGHFVEKSFVNVIGFSSYPASLDTVLSSSGNIAYRSENALIIENVITGQRRTFPGITAKKMAIRWSPNGDYALLFGGDLWLLSVKHNAITLLLDIVSFDPFDWAFDYTRVWSPDSRHALFVYGEKLFHISAEEFTIKEIPDFVGELRKEYILDWSWQKDAEAMLYLIQFSSSDTKTTLTSIDFKANTTERIPINTTAYTLPLKNNDGRYLTYIDEGPMIYDLKTKTTQTLRPAAGAYNSARGGETTWQRDGNWFFAFDQGLVAGGGDCCRHIGIVRADGIIRRDLTFVRGRVSLTSAGWLPQQVRLASLPRPLSRSLFPQPTTILKGDRWWFELAWSPDNKQLIGSDGDMWNYENRVVNNWNIEAKKSTVVFSKLNEKQAVSWQQNADGSYYPVLRTSTPSPILAISPNGQQIVSYTNYDGHFVGVFDAKSGGLLCWLDDLSAYDNSASFSPDGQLLALGDPYQPAFILDTHSWRKIAELQFPAPAVAFSPDGKYLAASSAWDVNIWKVSDLLAQDSF